MRIWLTFFMVFLLNNLLAGQTVYKLTSDTTIVIKNFGEVKIDKGSKLVYDSSGALVEITPIKAIKLGDLVLAPNKAMELYPSGQIKSVYPLYPYTFTIGGFKATAEPLSPVDFYEDGNVKKIYLTHDLTLKNSATQLIFKAGSYIEFYDNGQVKMGLLKVPAEFDIDEQQIVLKADRPVRFYPNGKLMSGFVQIPVDLRDEKGNLQHKEKNEYVHFDERGLLVE